jgi:hypothetical protein
MVVGRAGPGTDEKNNTNNNAGTTPNLKLRPSDKNSARNGQLCRACSNLCDDAWGDVGARGSSQRWRRDVGERGGEVGAAKSSVEELPRWPDFSTCSCCSWHENGRQP